MVLLRVQCMHVCRVDLGNMTPCHSSFQTATAKNPKPLNLIAMAPTLRAMASNLLAMALTL